MCLLDVDPNLFFLLPTRRGLRGHPCRVLQGTSHRPRTGSAFSVRVVRYWNKRPGFRRYRSFCQHFQEDVGGSVDRSFSPFPALTEISSHPPPFNLHTTHLQLSSLNVTKLPVMSMWFLQARCGLLFTIINHNQNSHAHCGRRRGSRSI